MTEKTGIRWSLTEKNGTENLNQSSEAYVNYYCLKVLVFAKKSYGTGTFEEEVILSSRGNVARRRVLYET